MTTITDELMTSDQTHHVARYSPAADGQGAWIVPWLPLRMLTRTQAIAAMTFAEAVAMVNGDFTHRMWPFLLDWAAELDLEHEEALRLVNGS